MITTTLNRIRAHRPSSDDWIKLLTGLGKTKADDEPLPFARIFEINGLDDALWCCRAEPQYAREWRLFSCWCARQNWHLLEDPRSRAAIEVAERYANGDATDAELDAARDAARAAARAAAGDAAWAARAAAWAARDTAGDVGAVAWAARVAAGDVRAAAWDARDAAWAARDASWAARAAAWAARVAEFLRVVTETEPCAALPEGRR